MIKNVNDLEIKNIISNNDKLIMVFGEGNNCGVCHAVKNRVNSNLLDKFPNLDIYYILVEDNPLFRGEYLIFTFPTLMLFDGNKEIHRESRIVDFNRLERILDIYFN